MKEIKASDVREKEEKKKAKERANREIWKKQEFYDNYDRNKGYK